MNELILAFATYVLNSIPVAIGTSYFYTKKEKQWAVIYLFMGFAVSFSLSPVVAGYTRYFATSTLNGEYFLVGFGLFFYVFFVLPFVKKKKKSN